MITRKCDNWLKELQRFTEETESPPHFWLWAGISAISGALERKVWVPFGLDDIYPNLFIFIVAPPGRCRKGAPVGFVKRILTKIGCNICVDSTTRASLVRELANSIRAEQFSETVIMQTTPMIIVSKELSSLLGVDLKSMVEVLTDLYDCHDEWEYKTKGGMQLGEKDKIYAPCLSLIAASTPNWIATNIPPEVIGDGFTSRIIMVSATERLQRVTIPQYNAQAYENLLHDLKTINMLKGEFRWEEKGYEYFDHWYQHTIDEKYHKEIKDDRFIPFLERLHTICLKVAMALRVSYSDELILTEKDITAAVLLLEDLLPNLPDAFGALGRNRLSQDFERILEQIKRAKRIEKTELLKRNWRHVQLRDFEEILMQIRKMDMVKFVIQSDGKEFFTWKGES